MLAWFSGFAIRYFKFTLYTVGAFRAFSWLFGFDQEAAAWTSQNRILIAILLGIAAIIYAMYDWLRSNEP